MAIASAFLGLLLISSGLPAPAGANTTVSVLSSCLSSANLQTVTSSSSAYAADTLAYNRRLSYKPIAVVFPTTAQSVADAVKCASNAGVKVAARSGGHSYAANGLGGQNGSLIIDLKNLNRVNVTASSQTAVFGTGTRLGDLALALYNGGKQAMAHGKMTYEIIYLALLMIPCDQVLARTSVLEDIWDAVALDSLQECGDLRLTLSLALKLFWRMEQSSTPAAPRTRIFSS